MESKKIFVVIGGQWFDKVNGNTYHNAKIIETDGEKNIYYSGYEYGYGSQYMTSAKRFVEEELKISNYELVNAGFFPVNKRNLKDNLF